MSDKPYIISGGIHEDDRGKLVFFNDFDMSEIKRFYIIANASINSKSDPQISNTPRHGGFFATLRRFPVPSSRFPSNRHHSNMLQLTQHPLGVRAWQGHKIEKKYFFVNSGSFLIAAVKIDDWTKPSPELQPDVFKLKADKPQILYIPPGYANGIKPLEQNAMLTVYSNLDLEESKKDDYRFAASLWLDWEKEVG